MDQPVRDDKDVPAAETVDPAAGSAHPEQVHPEHDAHGGSMAPGVVDDTGNPIGDVPGADTTS